MVNFVPALAYHFCLNLPAAFTQPGARLLVEPCTSDNFMIGFCPRARNLGKPEGNPRKYLNTTQNVRYEFLKAPIEYMRGHDRGNGDFDSYMRERGTQHKGSLAAKDNLSNLVELVAEGGKRNCCQMFLSGLDFAPTDLVQQRQVALYRWVLRVFTTG